MLILKHTADHIVDFAAEELKKYLRMMRPQENDIPILPAAPGKEGLRVGLMTNFELDVSECQDPALDDLLHIEVDENAVGIIAGSNPRSVLFAVYRYLYANGCRWLLPGIDGEYIPVSELGRVSYHKKADFRYRGQCNEGCESQRAMIETIDLNAKLGLNVYMLEFDTPFEYYDRYYSHVRNQANRDPEPITEQTVLQYKRQCEAEISKRGLQFHDMGHGWTAEPFGFSIKNGWKAADPDQVEGGKENRIYLAEVNGKRELHNGVAVNTNICMSNPQAREKIVRHVAEYAERHSNADVIHVWLADGSNNHCECEVCRKLRPSDWYVRMMNEIDEALTEKGLSSRIAFIAYVDTLWAPVQETIRNPERFVLLFAPISRKYTQSLADAEECLPEPYVRNKLRFPASAGGSLAYLKQWQENWHGDCFSYEYHFHLAPYYDIGTDRLTRTLWQDIRSLKKYRLNGIVEDGSQRNYFPNGFEMYLYGASLFDSSLSYEEILEDYYSHLYGDEWKEVYAYLSEVSRLLDIRYLLGEASENAAKGRYYAPSREKDFLRAIELTAEAEKRFGEPKPREYRVTTVAYRLLRYFFTYCRGIAGFLALKCVGKDSEAYHAAAAFYRSFGAHEVEIEPYFDHGLAVMAFERVVGSNLQPDVTQFG